MYVLRASLQMSAFLCKAMKIQKNVCRFGLNTVSCDNHLKYTSTISTKRFASTVSSDDPKWPRIYHLPSMRYIAAMSRLKLYQTVFTVFCVPMCSILYTKSLITLFNIQLIGGTATLALTTLVCFSYYSRRLIGLMYFNEATQMVKISHLTFWGRKKNIYVPLQDIVPLTDGNCKANDAYVKLCRYSTKDHLLLSLRFGRIYRKTEFELIFGNLDFLYTTKK